jgi:hypothetical protein
MALDRQGREPGQDEGACPLADVLPPQPSGSTYLPAWRQHRGNDRLGTAPADLFNCAGNLGPKRRQLRSPAFSG